MQRLFKREGRGRRVAHLQFHGERLGEERGELQLEIMGPSRAGFVVRGERHDDADGVLDLGDALDRPLAGAHQSVHRGGGIARARPEPREDDRYAAADRLSVRVGTARAEEQDRLPAAGLEFGDVAAVEVNGAGRAACRDHQARQPAGTRLEPRDVRDRKSLVQLIDGRHGASVLEDAEDARRAGGRAAATSGARTPRGSRTRR